MVVAHQRPTQAERYQAFTHLLESVDDPRCPRPIPRFMLDIPWATDEDEVSERIIAQLLSADNPYTAMEEGATKSGKDLVGQKVVIHDLRVRPSDKSGGWGAYLILDCTVGERNDHQVVTIGAKQAVSIIAYAHFNGDFPLTGTFTVVTETSNGNTVLGFVREDPF